MVYQLRLLIVAFTLKGESSERLFRSKKRAEICMIKSGDVKLFALLYAKLMS